VHQVGDQPRLCFSMQNAPLSIDFWIKDGAHNKGAFKFVFTTVCCTIETDKDLLKSCIMRACGKDNAPLISNIMMKMKGGFSVTLCGGNIELMAKRKSVPTSIYVGKVEFEQVSSAQSRRMKDENLFNPLNAEIISALCWHY